MGEPRGDEVQFILEDTLTRGGRERVKEEDVISKEEIVLHKEREDTHFINKNKKQDRTEYRPLRDS